MGLITSLRDTLKLFIAPRKATTTLGIHHSRLLIQPTYSSGDPRTLPPSSNVLAALGASLSSVDWISGQAEPKLPIRSAAKEDCSAQKSETNHTLATLTGYVSSGVGVDVASTTVSESRRRVTVNDFESDIDAAANKVYLRSPDSERSDRSSNSDRTGSTTMTSVNGDEFDLVSQFRDRHDSHAKIEACANVSQDPPSEAIDAVIEHEIDMAARDVTVNLKSVSGDGAIDQDKAYRDQLPDPTLGEEIENYNVSQEWVDKPLSGADDNVDHSDRDNGKDTDDDDAHLERHDWEPIRQIPDHKFKDLALQFVDLSGQLEREDVDVFARFEGGSHHVVMLRVYDEDEEQDYVIKVPAVGTQARWRLGDAHNMAAEAALMRYLFEHTNVPVPEVIASGEDLATTLGAPYILMKRVFGRPAYDIWYDDVSAQNHVTAGRISEETEAKRVNMLRSLAKVMAGLQTMELKDIGMPIFTDGRRRQHPRAVHSYRWKDPYSLTPIDLESDTQLYQYGPFASSIEYMTGNLDTSWPKENSETLDKLPAESRLLALGIRKVLDIISSHPVIKTSKPPNAETSKEETFVLQHPDLDLQNILVDDDGNVTGILDWDGCLAVPRCVGYASFPDFLRRDWQHDFTLSDSPYMSFQLDRYRQIYAEAMEETGCPDARFTRKSAMYRAIEEALTGEGDCPVLIKKILLELPGLRRTNIKEFLMHLGRDDWTEAEEWLSQQIEELLNSTPMPS